MARKLQVLFSILALVLGMSAWRAGAATFGDTAVHLVPTFHSIGIYWAPGGNVGNVTVRFRPLTNPPSAFRDGLPLWFDDRNGGLSYHQEYRGSIVELQPGAAYEIQLTPSAGSAPAVPQVRTWNTRPDDVPDNPTTVPIAPRTTNLTITAGGDAASGYKVYDGWNGTSNNEISVGTSHDNCITVNASYVVVRRVKCIGGLRSGIQIADGFHNVVIEDVEVTDFEQAARNVTGWGNAGENDEGAVKLGSRTATTPGNNSKILVQRSRLHTPRWGSTPWSTGGIGGPYGIFTKDAGAQNVFRWNEISSSGTEHQWFQDCIGGTHNESEKGAPGPDSDIYQNALANCYDDGIEAEGGNRNVRVWGNYLNKTAIVMGNAVTVTGPLYLWRNVSDVMGKVRDPLTTNPDDEPERGPFIKGGSTTPSLNGGRAYYFHNTALQPPPSACSGVQRTCGAGMGVNRAGGPLSNFVSWNNIWHIHKEELVNSTPKFYSVRADGDLSPPLVADFDVRNGQLENASASGNTSGWEINGWGPGAAGRPIYATSGTGYPDVAAHPGDFTLSPKSPGHFDFDATRKPKKIENFNDQYAKPDAGAHQSGTPLMLFGLAAGQQSQSTGPSADFTATQAATPALTMAFDASSSKAGSSPISTYTWDFGDAQSGSGVQTSHTYAAAGDFNVKLTVVDGNGLSANITKPLTVNPAPPQPPVSPGQAFELDFDIQPGPIAVQGATLDVTIGPSDATRKLSQVRFFVDGALMATDSAAPFQFSWASPGTGGLGDHRISAEATDAGGAIVTKARTVRLQSQTCNAIPGAASVQQGTAVSIQGVCSDATSVAQMELYVDNVLRTADVGAPFTWTLDTSSLTAGTHTIMIRALLSPSGEASHSVSLDVTAAPLTLSFTPGPIVMRSDRMTVSATATDGRALRQVDFYVDGMFLRGETQSPFELQWNTTSADRHGRHTLVVLATDAAGNVLSATRDVYLTTRTCNVLMASSKYLVGSHDTVFAGPHSIPQGQLVTVQGVCAVPVQRMEFYLDDSPTPQSIDSTGPTFTWTFPTSPATAFAVDSVHKIAIKGVLSPTGESNHSIMFEIIAP